MKKILIQKVRDNQIFFGARYLNSYDEGLLSDYPTSSNNNPITFREIDVVDVQDDFTKAFLSQKEALDWSLHILNDHLSTHVMTVGFINPRCNAPKSTSASKDFTSQRAGAVELLPDYDILQNYKFYLSYQYYYETKHEWGRLATGDKVKVVFSSHDASAVYCEVKDIISSSQKQIAEIRLKSARIRLDLASMAGHVLLGANLLEATKSLNSRTGVTHTNLKMGLNGFELYPNIDFFSVPIDISGGNLAPGTQYNVWVGRIEPDEENKKNKMFDLWVNQLTKYKISQHSPTVRPEQELSSVVGVVSSYSTGKNLLWANFDDGEWCTCVFRNNIAQKNITSSQKTEDKNDMSVWGTIIREYLPLGFPATFHLDLCTGKSNCRLFLLGFNPGKLKGRVSSDSEARLLQNRILQDSVYASPYAMRDGGIMLTSDGYAGFAPVNNLPKALVEYSKNRVFSTELKVPARVEIKSCAVVFNVNICLEKELQRLRTSVGCTEQMKICAIYLGKVYLTTIGGYPVEYICRDEEEETEIRKQMFGMCEFTVTAVEEDWIVVNKGVDFNTGIKNLEIPFGGLFYADKTKNSASDKDLVTVKGLDCLVVPETLDSGNDLKGLQSPLMLIGVDKQNKHLLAVAHHERLYDKIQSITYVEIIRQLLPEMWLCSKDGAILLMNTTETQSHLLNHLKTIYGKLFSIQVEPLENEESFAAHCKWRGIGCGADYRALFSGRNIKLHLSLSAKTPKVLFYDAVLTAPTDLLQSGSIGIVQLTGEISEDGAFVCRQGDVSGAYEPVAFEETRGNNIAGQLMGTVIEAEDEKVIFKIGDEEVLMDSEEQLHIPIQNYIPLSDIFLPGSEWAVMLSDDCYHLNNSCPDALAPYVLIKERKIARRLRNGNDWVVKGENGQIAIAKSVVAGEKDDKLLMIYDYDNSDEYVNCVAESEELLIGQEVPMLLKDMDVQNRVILCQPVDKLKITDCFEIPMDLWNWSISSCSLKQIESLKDCAFVAKIKDWEQDVTILNRRCLIPQCELMRGTSVEPGMYQMRVSGFNSQGYRLTQNDVTVTLQWHEASFMTIPDDEIFRREYLLQGSLLTAYLCEESGKTVARWRSEQKEKFAIWMAEAKDTRQEPKMMKVHHIGTAHLFLEYDGVLLYVSATDLGKWSGCLDKAYQIGQVIDGLLKWDETAQVFYVEPTNSGKHRTMPEVDAEYEGCVIKYFPNGDCNVEFGEMNEWVATIKFWNLSWEPYPQGKHPYNIGEVVKIKVKEIDHTRMRILASVKDCIPRPLTGPASVDSSENPHLQFFTYVRELKDLLVLQNEDGVEAELAADDSYLPLKELKEKILDKNGIWLAVTGVTETSNRLICSYSKIIDAYCQLASRGAGVVLKCVIRSIPDGKRLIVSNGIIIGRIPHLAATGQSFVKPIDIYKPGQEVECYITSFDNAEFQFVASIVKAKPNGWLDMLPQIKIDGDYRVKVVRVNDKGALVQIHNSVYKGVIPFDEISHKPELDVYDWGEKYNGEILRVKCISIEPDKGIIFFSRKRVISPEAE